MWGDGWGGRGGGVVEWCGVVVCWVVRDGGVVRVVRVVGWVVDIRYSTDRWEIRSNPKQVPSMTVNDLIFRLPNRSLA